MVCLDDSFFESHCWAKLKAIIFCAVAWHGKNADNAELIEVTSLDFAETSVVRFMRALH